MDIDEVDDPGNNMDAGGRHWEEEGWGSMYEHLEAMYKGKGKGKGKYGKSDGPYGKAGFKGSWWTPWSTMKGFGNKAGGKDYKGSRKRGNKRKRQRNYQGPVLQVCPARTYREGLLGPEPIQRHLRELWELRAHGEVLPAPRHGAGTARGRGTRRTQRSNGRPVSA